VRIQPLILRARSTPCSYVCDSMNERDREGGGERLTERARVHSTSTVEETGAAVAPTGPARAGGAGGRGVARSRCSARARRAGCCNWVLF